jgi:hypothetical protein
MKTLSLIFKYYLALFLVICLGVHVYGLYTHYSNETTQSHITHLVSYSLCLLAVLVKLRYRFLVYSFASVYPFLYHANCAWAGYINAGRLNPICIYVVIMMPLGMLWVLTEAGDKPANQ